METVYLSPSSIATYENCPMAYFLGRKLRVDTVLKSAALGFGGAMAKAMEAFKLGTVTGEHVDPVPVFVDAWESFTANNTVKYGKYETEESLTATGTKLMQDYPSAWAREGLTVALDAQGVPMIERKFTVDLGESTMLKAKLDLMAYDRDWKLLLIDEKTSRQVTDIRFALMGEQLTAYQMTVKAHEQSLGLPDVQGLAYWELIKRAIPKSASRGQGPTIEPISSVDARSDEAVSKFVRKARAIAQRVRDGDFPKTPRMAWNTPCTNCDFLDLCAQRRTDGLVFKSEEYKEAALLAVA